MQNFIESSTIHGTKYIFDPTFSKLTKFLWILIILCSFGGLGYYIRSAYVKLYISPDISITTRDRKVEDFPYPAVTVCTSIFSSNKKANFLKFQNPKENETNYTKSECLYAAANSHWCRAKFEILAEKCQEYLKEINEIDPIKLMVESVPDIEVKFDRFKRNTFQTLTYFGICHTSNMQDFDNIFTDEIHDDFRGFYQSYDKSFEWSPQRGYFSENSTYPQRLKLGNVINYATVINNHDSENECIIKKILLHFHLPNEIPTQYLKIRDTSTINFDEALNIKLVAKSFRAEIDLNEISLKFRKCYFENERKLRFFKIYTLNHCKLECLSNITLAEYGCVKFYMPRDKITEICKLSVNQKLKKFDPDLDECECLPLCNDVKYSYVIERFPMPTSFHSEGEKISKLISSSVMQIFFQLESVEEVEKFLGYKLQNFISDVGGLLGLFLGCSLISVVEIFFLISQGISKKFESKQNVANDLREEFESFKKKHEMIDRKLRKEIKEIKLEIDEKLKRCEKSQNDVKIEIESVESFN